MLCAALLHFSPCHLTVSFSELNFNIQTTNIQNINTPKEKR